MATLIRPKQRAAAKQSGKLTKAERVAKQDAEDRHTRARCAIQIATQFLSDYYAAHPPLKVINPLTNPSTLTADDFPDQEDFNK